MDKQMLIIPIEEARKIMGEAGKNYSDTEIKEIIHLLTLLSDIVIDDKVMKRQEVQI